MLAQRFFSLSKPIQPHKSKNLPNRAATNVPFRLTYKSTAFYVPFDTHLLHTMLLPRAVALFEENSGFLLSWFFSANTVVKRNLFDDF